MFRRSRNRIALVFRGSRFRKELDEEMAILDETVRNLRFAFRGMARSPLFSSTFILTLALCIGLGTAVFSVVDAELPVARMASLQGVMDEAFARERFEAAFLLVVAGFALLLAGIGLYGIVAHEVLERRAEMGLRMALGATPGQAVWTTGLSGVLLTFIGLLLGGALAVPVGRVMVGLVYGVTPFDPPTMGFLAGVLALFSTVASFVPAARIGRTDPAEILREG